MESKICLHCGEVFNRPPEISNHRWDGRRFCGHSCSTSWHNRNDKIEPFCLQCGKAITVDSQRVRTKSFCDDKCRYQYKKPVSVLPVSIPIPVKPVVTERISPVNYQTQCPKCSRLAAVGEIFCNRHW